jgi:carbonic anhydrase
LGAAGLGLLPGRAFAAKGESEFMLLSCMDPRLVHTVHEQMEARKLRDKYSQVALAGGPAAAVAPAFKKWQNAIWDNLGVTIELHKIKRAFGLTHYDCAAVRIAYGNDAVLPAMERATHIRILRAFRMEVSKRHPTLGCETGIMSLDGSIEMITA